MSRPKGTVAFTLQWDANGARLGYGSDFILDWSLFGKFDSVGL